MIFAYNKKNAEVIAYSEGYNKYDNKNIVQIEYEPTSEELFKMEHTWKPFMKRKKLVLIKTPRTIDVETIEKRDEAKKNLLKILKNNPDAKVSDIAPDLIKLFE